MNIDKSWRYHVTINKKETLLLVSTVGEYCDSTRLHSSAPKISICTLYEMFVLTDFVCSRMRHDNLVCLSQFQNLGLIILNNHYTFMIEHRVSRDDILKEGFLIITFQPSTF